MKLVYLQFLALLSLYAVLGLFLVASDISRAYQASECAAIGGHQVIKNGRAYCNLKVLPK